MCAAVVFEGSEYADLPSVDGDDGAGDVGASIRMHDNTMLDLSAFLVDKPRFNPPFAEHLPSLCEVKANSAWYWKFEGKRELRAVMDCLHLDAYLYVIREGQREAIRGSRTR